MTFDDQQDTTIPSDWFFNVHDDTGNALSIACSPIQVDSSGLTGSVHLSPVQLQSQNLTALSTTQGDATLHLEPNAQLLAVQANVSNAPPNTALVMHIHGGNSCTGPILFPLQATSDNTGHATATMIFDDQQDTTIPSDWFFNVHDTTKTGPDGKPLSISCGPIQVDSSGLTGEATLSPVQPEGQNVSTLSTTQGLTTLHVDTNAHTLTIETLIFGAPPNTPLVMHVHGDGSCTGPILFPLRATSDNAGHALASMTFSQDINSNPLPTTIPSNWFFNVHDTTRQGLDGKPLSIACGPIQSIDPTTGFAKLDPVQSPVAPTPTQNPLGVTTLSTTEGLTTLQLDPNAHTLTIQANIFGAPPNTPLVMHVHGDGSCAGPILFPLQATSDFAGNASAIMTVKDVHNNTIPKNWFFNVHNTTRQAPDGKPLSIACGPIQVVDPSNLMAYALVLPVQPSQTAPIAPLPIPQGTTTQGLSVLFLNTAQHILNVLVHLIGAPPNTPLALDIHGDGSCTGPTLFMIPATSNVTGNATALMPFNNVQDTKIPNNWFFTVHDPTKKGPDGQPLSIACGPIQTPGQVGLAQLTPVLGPLTSVQ
jgi:Cu/Zn superoxide dismutase